VVQAEKSADKPGTSTDSSSLSCRVTNWRRAPTTGRPLLSTSTPLPYTKRKLESLHLVVSDVWCVSIWAPSPHIYKGEPLAICSRIDSNRHGGPTTCYHVHTERRWGPWAADTWSTDRHGRPTVIFTVVKAIFRVIFFESSRCCNFQENWLGRYERRYMHHLLERVLLKEMLVAEAFSLSISSRLPWDARSFSSR